MEIARHVRLLNLPKNSCVVIGSGPLHAAGLRRARDIDLVVTPDAFVELSLRQGWRLSQHASTGDSRLERGPFDISTCWHIGEKRLTTRHLLDDATWIDDVAFANLSHILEWKQCAQRRKDLGDIHVLRRYLRSRRLNTSRVLH